MQSRVVCALLALGASIFSPNAVACDLDHWSSVAATAPGVSLKTGQPDDATPVSRYSGYCAMVASAPGNYVNDESPNSETKFYARFYVLAATTGGPVTIFRARNAANTTMLAVRYTGSSFEFVTRGSNYASSAPVVPGRWYAIQLSWLPGSAMTAKVQGAGSAALPLVTTEASLAGDRVDSVSLGWIEGAATGSITIDAYESRRLTAVGRLCRGNADANHVRNSRDQISAREEFLKSSLAKGQPDCNEDGAVDSGDLVCMRNMEQSGQGDCDSFPDL